MDLDVLHIQGFYTLSDKRLTALEPSLASRLLQIIEPLQHTRTGAALYQHLLALAEQSDQDHLASQQAYGALLNDITTLLINALPADSAVLPHLRLIQQRLQSPMTLSDLHILRRALATASAAVATVPSPPPAATDTTATRIPPDPAGYYDSLLEELAPVTSRMEQATPQTVTPAPTGAEQTATGGAHLTESPDQKVDLTYRRHLDDKRERILKIQKTLSRHVNEVTKQNEEFGVLLEVEYDALRQAQGISEMNMLRQSLLHEVEKLIKGNHVVASKLDKAKNYLKIIESEGQHLNDELTRVHILSLTDELTELPNRRAFMRRLEDEVARVQRYGSPLSLALIDMDSFKSINDKLGHTAGDEVLRTFSNHVLSIFRHHDMVARYGGEEFAILLPNTDLNGTRRALEKVREQSSHTTFHYHNRSLPLPTFSAGVALYRPGETSSNLIERADKALYRAKDQGRNRIEVASQEHTPGSTSGMG